MEGHWDVIRPGMIRKVLNVKIHARPDAPVAAFSATVTEAEVELIQGLMGRNRRLQLIGNGPVLNNHKVMMIRRPPSQAGLLGSEDKHQPGLLDLLRVLVLDRLVICTKGGKPFDHFEKSIIIGVPLQWAW